MKKSRKIVLAVLLVLAIMVGTTSSVLAHGHGCGFFYYHQQPHSAANRNSDNKLNYTIVVNSEHPYEFGGSFDTVLQDRLVAMPNYDGECVYVEKSAADAFVKLQQALYKKGMMVQILGCYRSEEDQKQVHEKYEGTAEPGYSEHHTGLLMSIVIWHQFDGDATPVWCTETAERQASIPEFKIVHETLADYGFIDRYPAGKEDITGIPCEPYEVRYVGSSKVAHSIMDHGITLEEYVYGNNGKNAKKRK